MGRQLVYFMVVLMVLGLATCGSAADLVHRWSFNGETMAEVTFNIGGPRWRVYSSKKLIPSWAGMWKAEVIDADGIVMNSKTFEYYEPE